MVSCGWTTRACRWALSARWSRWTRRPSGWFSGRTRSSCTDPGYLAPCRCTWTTRPTRPRTGWSARAGRRRWPPRSWRLGTQHLARLDDLSAEPGEVAPDLLAQRQGGAPVEEPGDGGTREQRTQRAEVAAVPADQAFP